MVKEEIKLLKDISRKLDQLIILAKLSNAMILEEFKRKLKKDKVAFKILENADGSQSYSAISKKVADELGVAEITVKKKISELKERGILMPIRRGKEVYYENTGLLD